MKASGPPEHARSHNEIMSSHTDCNRLVGLLTSSLTGLAYQGVTSHQQRQHSVVIVLVWVLPGLVFGYAQQKSQLQQRCNTKANWVAAAAAGSSGSRPSCFGLAEQAS